MPGIREKFLKYIGIEKINDDVSKTLLEVFGGKTRLGAFGFLVIWFIGFFLLIDVILPLLTIGRPETLLPSVKNYIFYVLFPWTSLWFYCVYLLFYYRNKYLKTIKNKLSVEEYKKLKKQLLPHKGTSNNSKSKERRIELLILIIFISLLLLAQIYNTYLDYCAEPSILWGYVTLEELGMKTSSLALIYMFLHCIPGCLVQVLILADLFVIMYRFLFLANRLLDTLKIDVWNVGRRGGLGFIGNLYLKISIGYFIALLLFIFMVFFVHRYPWTHPWMLGLAVPLIITLVASLFGLFFFMHPRDQFIENWKKRKRSAYKKLVIT